jgi:hypothetical protein
MERSVVMFGYAKVGFVLTNKMLLILGPVNSLLIIYEIGVY